MGSLLIIYTEYLNYEAFIILWFIFGVIHFEKRNSGWSWKGVISIVSTRYRVIQLLEECPGNINVFPWFVMTGFYIHVKLISSRSLDFSQSFLTKACTLYFRAQRRLLPIPIC
jgi:hypothetical protein